MDPFSGKNSSNVDAVGYLLRRFLGEAGTPTTVINEQSAVYCW